MKKEIDTSTIYRANAKSIATQLVKVENGLGTSKIKARNESGMKGQNGHKISDLIHSAKAMDNFKSVSQSYFQHVKDTVGGKIEASVSSETIKDFLLTNLANEKINGGTASTYLSVLEKTSTGLTKLTNKIYITKAEFKQIRTDLKKEYSLQSEHRNRAFENPQNIIKQMDKFSEFFLSSKLQLETGMRSDDAENSSKWKQNEDGTISIKGSKGGIEYTTAPASKELQDRVKAAIKNGYSVAYSTYTRDLKEAVTSAGEVWAKKSTHGLRYNFAQSRMKQLLSEGKSYLQAKGQVSLEMGHSRISITDVYVEFR